MQSNAIKMLGSLKSKNVFSEGRTDIGSACSTNNECTEDVYESHFQNNIILIRRLYIRKKAYVIKQIHFIASMYLLP